MISGLTSIILPSAHRPVELERYLTALYSSKYDQHPIELLVSIIDDDTESAKVLSKFSIEPVWIRTNDDYGRGQLWACTELYKLAHGEWIALMADDLVPSPGWLDEALLAMSSLSSPGVVAFNDLHSDGNLYAAHSLVGRKFVDEYLGGRLFPPYYKVWWVDREISDKAKAVGLYAWAKKSVVEHRHWNWNLAKVDQTYADAIPFYGSDEKVYISRKEKGFPIDWK